ncbi:MAG: rhomboid family intramembrane serine protease [Candidatus Lokiarchaeota archaeon]|nr:rhomboid family intramembrane serine protease [Candidatus Lokiarchaeota archaeon]
MIFLDMEHLKDAKITLSLVFLNIVSFLIFNLALPVRYLLFFVQINRNIINNYEIWRLITPIFFHANELHLFSNMIALLLFGATVETNQKLSKLEFLLIYFISGFVGNVFSLFLLPFDAISLGASGAIFGLIGVALVMVIIDNRALLPFALLYIGYFIIASFMPGINIWAHIFGLLVGLLLGYLFYYRKNQFTKLD